MNQNELAAIHLPMKDSFDKSSFVDAFFVNTAVGEKEGERERDREREREFNGSLYHCDKPYYVQSIRKSHLGFNYYGQ